MALMADLFRVFCCFWLFIGRIAAQSEHRVPDPPENVRVKLEATSATLWWEPPSTAGDILVRGYTISYGIETPSRRVVIEGVDTNAFTIEGLKPNATYVFAVTAYNEADGEDSERVLLTGTSHAADPRNSAFRFPAPSDITVIGTSATDVEISWTDPMPESRDENSLELGTKRRFYIVRYYASTHPEKARKISTEKTKAFITNLTPETSYNILIRTVLPNGQESPWSREEVVKTSSKHQNHNDLAFLNTPSTRVHVSESCDFEVPYLCDFFSEATAPLQFRREASVSTGGTMSTHSGDAGHYMVAQSSQDLKDTFGRLFSPVWNFNAAGHICVSLWVYVRADSYGILTVSVQYEGDSINMAVPVFKKRMEGMKKQKWSEITAESKIHRHKSFQLIVEVRKASPRARFWVAVDDIHARGGHCAHSKGLLKGNVADEETDVDLLTPLENLINTDPRVYRTKGLDGLPAVGIQRGVEIVVPYRIYLPRKFYRNFAIVASIKPKDDQGGYLFAVVNAFDTVVDLGLHLSPAGRAQTNVSLVYTDSQTESSSTVIASFLVPAFTNQWTQLAVEVSGDNVALYFRCMRFATRQVRRTPMQLQMDDASKLYIANAGPIIGNGFEVGFFAFFWFQWSSRSESPCVMDNI